MRFPQACHITWSSYGARLPGSGKPFVDRGHNEYGSLLPQRDSARERAARERMREDPVKLTIEQRKEVERAIDDVCQRYGWIVHSKASQSDHTRVVVTAPRKGEQLRDALKACATRALNKRFCKRTWWVEGGSARYLWENDYFRNVTDYVHDQRDW